LEESKDLIWGKLRNEKMNEGRMEWRKDGMNEDLLVVS
jgi:hypothetical protein